MENIQQYFANNKADFSGSGSILSTIKQKQKHLKSTKNPKPSQIKKLY
jgi:hypothetical protein